MSQWTINCYGERVHKRQRRRRANCVFLFKKIIKEDDERRLKQGDIGDAHGQIEEYKPVLATKYVPSHD